MEEPISIKVTPDREWVKPGEAATLAIEVADPANRQGEYVLVGETEQGRFQKYGIQPATLFEDEGRNYVASVVRLKPGQTVVRRHQLVAEDVEGSGRLAPEFRLYSRGAFAGTSAQHLLAGIGGGGLQPLGTHRPVLRIGEPGVITGPGTAAGVLPVTLTRASEPFTEDEALWWVIRDSTEALSFNRYRTFIDAVLCQDTDPGNADVISVRTNLERLAKLRRLPFPDTDAYRTLKVATEAYLQANCGVDTTERFTFPPFTGLSREFKNAAIQRFLLEEGIRTSQLLTPDQLAAGWSDYVTPDDGSHLYTIPYLALVAKNLDGISTAKVPSPLSSDLMQICQDFIYRKLVYPCLIELIWSYWHEEGMLVQTIKAIAWRFQNRRGPGDYDPLALLEIDPLRPLNNFIWGYIQDEQHRLTLPRRTYEYDHHYGLRLFGKAVPEVRGADTRSRFLEAFHNLLFLCSIFYKEDDDTTVVADGFPVLNALREVHLILTQGAHNQYGDLPSAARQEMMMEQWILARPEFREFLPRRVMVAYPEPWMQSVETMKNLQGWTDASILNFRELARYGERILLSARFGNWTSVMFPQSAANWARFFRAEVQGYIHAYRAVTGVDLTDRPDATMPGVLLRQRLTQQLSRQLPGRRRVMAIPKPPAGRLPAPRQQAQQQPSARAELPEWSETGI